MKFGRNAPMRAVARRMAAEHPTPAVEMTMGLAKWRHERTCRASKTPPQEYTLRPSDSVMQTKTSRRAIWHLVNTLGRKHTEHCALSHPHFDCVAMAPRALVHNEPPLNSGTDCDRQPILSCQQHPGCHSTRSYWQCVSQEKSDGTS